MGALKLIDGKSITIFNAIADIIDEFKLWNSIKMIVTDTTNVNTGKKNGVVVQLQDMFQKKDYKNLNLYHVNIISWIEYLD